MYNERGKCEIFRYGMCSFWITGFFRKWKFGFAFLVQFFLFFNTLRLKVFLTNFRHPNFLTYFYNKYSGIYATINTKIFNLNLITLLQFYFTLLQIFFFYFTFLHFTKLYFTFTSLYFTSLDFFSLYFTFFTVLLHFTSVLLIRGLLKMPHRLKIV